MLHRTFTCLVTFFTFLGLITDGYAKDANASQFFYIIKKVFPDVQNISVFISPSQFTQDKSILDRAAAQNQFKVKLFIIETVTDVGKSVRELEWNSVLVIFNSEELMQKSSQLYILKNCKEKHVTILTGSREYSDLGALLGLIDVGTNQFNLVLNLKQNEYQKEKFTSEFIQVAGIQEVIQ